MRTARVYLSKIAMLLPKPEGSFWQFGSIFQRRSMLKQNRRNERTILKNLTADDSELAERERVPQDAETDKAGRRVGDAFGALRETGIRELSLVRLTFCEGELCLDGDVATFYVKQAATEAVRPYAAGMQIRNRLNVSRNK